MNSCSALIVEDDQDLRSGLETLLSLEGIKSHSAENGKAALELLNQIPIPGVILLDLAMPVMNGWEFYDALRKNDDWKDVPVIVVTGNIDRPLPQGIELMRKPLDLDRLVSAVWSHCHN